MTPYSRPVLLFDGECNLCSRLVQFIIRNDKKKLFLFAPLQSESAKNILTGIKCSLSTFNSIVLVYRGKIFTKSAAALTTLRLLRGPWQLMYAGIVIPTFVRDAFYGWVARNRYKWFGKSNSCMVPAPELMDRFLP